MESEPHLGNQPPLCGSRRQLPCSGPVAQSWLRPQLIRWPFLPLGPLRAFRSFCQGRVLVCMGRPLGSPLLTFQEEFSSKAKARGCKLVASGLDPALRQLQFGLCKGIFVFVYFVWFVLSQ